MFVKLRAKSVGETASVNVECNHCKKHNKVDINLEELRDTENKSLESLYWEVYNV